MFLAYIPPAWVGAGNDLSGSGTASRQPTPSVRAHGPRTSLTRTLHTAGGPGSTIGKLFPRDRFPIRPSASTLRAAFSVCGPQLVRAASTRPDRGISPPGPFLANFRTDVRLSPIASENVALRSRSRDSFDGGGVIAPGVLEVEDARPHVSRMRSAVLTCIPSLTRTLAIAPHSILKIRFTNLNNAISINL